MVIRHLPNPIEAQKIRIPIIWKGDMESPVGKAMLSVDENGPVGFMVTKIIVDPQAGEVAAGRLFSGKIRRGQELWVIGMPKPQRAQTVAMIVGPDRIPVDEIDAGNVVAVVGLKDAIAGSTVSDDKEMQTFEKIVHYSDPVVTIAVEAKSTSDLPRLVEALRLIAKADPSIVVEINQETGEHLISGMGELHLRSQSTASRTITRSPSRRARRSWGTARASATRAVRSKASRRTSTTGSTWRSSRSRTKSSRRSGAGRSRPGSGSRTRRPSRRSSRSSVWNATSPRTSSGFRIRTCCSMRRR